MIGSFNPIVDIQLKSNKHTLPFSAACNFSPRKDIIFSPCSVIQLHSLSFENAILFLFLHFYIKTTLF
jgi:hypothetical protein